MGTKERQIIYTYETQVQEITYDDGKNMHLKDEEMHDVASATLVRN